MSEKVWKIVKNFQFIISTQEKKDKYLVFLLSK